MPDDTVDSQALTGESQHLPASGGALSVDRLLKVVALTFGYCLTGGLGLSVAIPPGYATAVWPPAPDSPGEASDGRVRRLLGRAVPALVLALVLGWLFEPWLGVLVALAAITLTTVGLVWPPAGRTIERILGGISHWVGRALSAVILTIVFVLVFLPVGLAKITWRFLPMRPEPMYACVYENNRFQSVKSLQEDFSTMARKWPITFSPHSTYT